MTNINFPETDVVGCKFISASGVRNQKLVVSRNSKEYYYKLLPGMEKPKIGDIAVVACINGIQAVSVTSVDCMCNFDGEMAYVVGLCDPTAYTEFLLNQQKKEILAKQLEAMKKELEESVTLDLLAEKSPEFKALLEAYRAL